LVAKLQLETFKILNEDTVLVDRVKSEITSDKPIYVGFCILEISKVLMYEFHYDVMKKNYGSNPQLLFTDTDSLRYHVITDDLYTDMMSLRDECNVTLVLVSPLGLYYCKELNISSMNIA